MAIEALVPEGLGFTSHFCSGSIVDVSHILTAAHCVFDRNTNATIPPADFTVKAGSSDLATPEAGEQERGVITLRPHPYYVYAPNSGRVGPDDVALLTLAQPLIASADVSPISVISPGSSLPEGTAVNLSGFGEENASTEELNGKLYALAMTLGYVRQCGGENDAVLLCGSSPSGSLCNGDSGSGLTLGSTTGLVGVADDYTLVAGQKCSPGADNAFANLTAPEIQEFLNGDETPPRAPRGGGAVIREAPAGDGVMSCEPGSWSESPTFLYTFLDSSDGQIVQQGPSTAYAVPPAEVGHMILCEIQASNAGGTGQGRTPPLNATNAAPVPQQAPPPSGTTTMTVAPPPPPPAGGLSLTSTNIVVQNQNVALLRLHCVGNGACRGKLTLTAQQTVKTRGRRKARRTVIIGTAVVSLAADASKTVKVKLNARGRALLSAGHGSLSVDLAVLQTEPQSAQTYSKAVRLVQQQLHRKKK